MDVTQRGQLDAKDVRRLLAAQLAAQDAEQERRRVVVEMVGKSSFREVERLTGISTNTLQRWKREAGEVMCRLLGHSWVMTVMGLFCVRCGERHG